MSNWSLLVVEHQKVVAESCGSARKAHDYIALAESKAPGAARAIKTRNVCMSALYLQEQVR